VFYTCFLGSELAGS